MNNSFESIKNHLLKQGFEYEGNLFTKIQQSHQLVVVNGQQHPLTLKIEFEYLGDGYIENADGTQEETCGMRFKVNGHDQVEVWARDAKEFQQLLSI